MAVQTLSNMVTANESLLLVLWETYMNLPEEQDILVCVLFMMGAPTTPPLLLR